MSSCSRVSVGDILGFEVFAGRSIDDILRLGLDHGGGDGQCTIRYVFLKVGRIAYSKLLEFWHVT